MTTRRKKTIGFQPQPALGIAHAEAAAAIRKARKPIGSSPSPEAWVLFAAKAANAAMLKSTAANLALADGEDDEQWQSEEERRAAARITFMANMPMLSSRKNVQAYIACVAAGVAMTIVTADEGSKLMYIAQNALAAYKGDR